MMARCIHHVSAWLALLIVVGCSSLPGYDDTDVDESSKWFARGDVEPGKLQDYEPEIRRITPTLIQELNDAIDAASRQLPRLPPNVSAGDYKIGPGDVLGVIVYGHPDITNPAGLTQAYESSGRVVDSSGKVFVPFAGPLDVAGLTASEARNLVADSLRRVINEPQVDIRVLQFRSQKIYITGDIAQPCTVPITDVPLTVVDALKICRTQLSGSASELTSVNAIELVRGDESYSIDVSSVYRRGGGPVFLQDGDRIIVDNRFSRVFVIGEFHEQKTVPVSATDLTLADAMAAAGGLNLETANPGAIFVIRGFVDTRTTDDGGIQTVVRPALYHLDARSVDAMILADQFRLQRRDVIYAAPASLVNFNRALAQITPSIDALFRTVIVLDRNR